MTNYYNPNAETFNNMSKTQRDEYLQRVSENFSQFDAARIIPMLDRILESDDPKSESGKVFDLFEQIAQRGSHD